MGVMAGTSAFTGCVSISEYNRTRAQLDSLRTRMEQMEYKSIHPLTRSQKLEIGFDNFKAKFQAKFDSQYDSFYAGRRGVLASDVLQSLEGIFLQSMRSSAFEGKTIPYEFSTTSNPAQLKDFASSLLAMLNNEFGIQMKVEYRANSFKNGGKTVHQTKVFAYPAANAGELAEKLRGFAHEHGSKSRQPVRVQPPE